MSTEEVLGLYHVGLLNAEDLIHAGAQRIEGWLDRVAASNGHVAVQDLSKHFSVGHEALALAGEPFEKPLGINLVWVVGAHQIHQHVRIDENHELSGKP